MDEVFILGYCEECCFMEVIDADYSTGICGFSNVTKIVTFDDTCEEFLPVEG